MAKIGLDLDPKCPLNAIWSHKPTQSSTTWLFETNYTEQMVYQPQAQTCNRRGCRGVDFATPEFG